MNRYVDKETMRGIIREQEKSHGIRGLAWVEMAMDKQEDADVQEVRHGRWSHFLCYNTCSLCGGVYVHEYDDGEKIQDFAFCPFCGAKMDEEEQE